MKRCRYEKQLSQRDRSVEIDLSDRVQSKDLKTRAHVPFLLVNQMDERDPFYQTFSPKTKYMCTRLNFILIRVL